MRRSPTAVLSATAIACVLAACTGGAAGTRPAASPATGTSVQATDPGATDPGTTPGGTTPGGTTPGGTTPDPDAVPADSPVAAQLVGFDSCDGLLDFYVAGAQDLVGPWGLGGGEVMMLEDGSGVATEAAESADAGTDVGGVAVQSDSAGAREVSGTNVQEEGVDEPDVVKSDGEVIVTVSDGGLRVVDVDAGEVVGRLSLPDDEAWNAELLLDGTDLLVLTTGGDWGGPGPAADRVPAFLPERTTITRVDLADPAAPSVVGSVRLEGRYRSARMVDGTVRVVLVSQPTGLSFVQPGDGGLDAEQKAEDINRQILAESDLDDWIPHLQVQDADGSGGEVRPVLDCGDITHPVEFSGLSTVSVLTLDIAGDSMEPTSGAGLVAAGDTVYASTDRLLVTTSPWGQWRMPFLEDLGRPDDGEPTTDLHAFDISDPASTTYVGSGEVAGTLIGQFALSEADGVVRVATTTEPDWWGEPQGRDESQSSLVVLAEQDGALVETGRVDGLGVTERIYAVRYLGPDLAAIVTFRETDPLYLVDTSDPTAPRVTGELKIPGFSSYLHQVGDAHLVGIGQDATEDGRTTGLQASLFDVGDVTAPARVDQVTLGEGWSPVESDHRAFLHWAPTGQVVVPAELWEAGAWEEVEDCADDCVEPRPFLGAVVLELDGDTVTEQGRVALDDDAGRDWWGEVRRTLVIDDDLWLVAGDRLVRVSLAGLDDRLDVPLR